jgi:hypothetical protein
MFQEDAQALAAAEKAASIESGKYEAVITGATIQKSRDGQGFGSFIITHTLVDGEFEGCDYTQFLTHSPKAAGVRAQFYRNIGYVRPTDGTIDENDFIGHNCLITLLVTDGNVKVTRVEKSARQEEESAAPDAAADDFAL